MAKILLVEDDFALAMGTEYALQAEDYEVVHVDTIKNARNALDATIDLVLLDVMLPDGTGYDFCKYIRENNGTVPIIFLTAMSEEVNIVQGLELGADDYVAKPYRVKELLSRIKAQLRRSQMTEVRMSSEVAFGQHIFYMDDYRLVLNGANVECTPSELRLLRELVQNQGMVLERNQLLEKLYDVDGAFIDDNTLSVYMKRLRDKLGNDANYIETVRGIGYRFRNEN